LQNSEIADVDATPQRIHYCVGERRDIAQTEIKTLSRDRMQTVRGIADQGQTRTHRFARAYQRERIGLPRANFEQTPEALAETRLQAREKLRVVQGHDGISITAAHGPHHAAALILQSVTSPAGPSR